MTGHYSYTEPEQTIRFRIYSSATDTMYAIVTMPAPGHMRWKMVFNKDSVFLELTKVQENLHR